MRRLFWVAVGVGAGATAMILLSRWMQRQAEAYAPANVARQAGAVARDTASLLAEAVREFRAGMVEKEAEMRASLG